ncbi:MAG: MFS transporter [bacterium]|nr:MFS transporter [bacterium]
MTAHDPYAPFRFVDFRRYLSGWFLALVGTQIQSIAIGWEIYQRTGEALSLGLVGLMQALPTILLVLPAGYIADRFDRRKVVTCSLLGMTITSIALAALSFAEGSIVLMYAILFLDATAATLGRPARSALLPQLVPRDVFPSAVTWNSSLMQMAWVIGPAIGGFVIAISVSSAYVLCAASSFAYVILLQRIHFRPIATRPTKVSLETLFGGLRFVGRNRLILSLMALDMFAVLLGGAVYLLPIFAENILNVGAQGFGWLRAAPAAGAFLTALFLAHRRPMRHAGRNLLLAVAGFGAATIVFGFSTSFWLSLAMLFLTGAFDNISMVVRHTLIQLLTPDDKRGRVSAVNSVFVGASNELGGMESGLVAHWFGPIVSVVSGGIGTIVVVLITATVAPGLRRVGAMHDVQPAEEENEAS